jgi:hypothetical protein
MFAINIPKVLIYYAPAGLECSDFAIFHPASRDVGILRGLGILISPQLLRMNPYYTLSRLRI